MSFDDAGDELEDVERLSLRMRIERVLVIETPHEGHGPRPLQENATRYSLGHAAHRPRDLVPMLSGKRSAAARLASSGYFGAREQSRGNPVRDPGVVFRPATAQPAQSRRARWKRSRRRPRSATSQRSAPTSLPTACATPEIDVDGPVEDGLLPRGNFTGAGRRWGENPGTRSLSRELPSGGRGGHSTLT